MRNGTLPDKSWEKKCMIMCLSAHPSAWIISLLECLLGCGAEKGAAIIPKGLVLFG